MNVIGSMEFRNYPISYRFSQGGMAVAFALILSPLSVVAQLDPNARFVVTAVFWAIVCISLCVSCYVIARYPFLSLVESNDGDHFMKYFASSGTRVYTLLQIAALMVVLFVIVSLLLNGKNDLMNFVKITYMVVMFCFFVFMLFAYKPVSHPTIATLVRATLGFGVLLFPIFIPALVVGSLRCKRLLDDASFECG